MSQEYMTVAEVAREKEVTITAVYKAIEQNRIRSTRILGRLALERSDVLAWQPKQRKVRKEGTAMSEETKVRISIRQKQRWAKLKESKQQQGGP